MEYLTSTMLSGMTYDLIKRGLYISVDTLRNKLKDWLINDEDIKVLVERINSIDQLEDLNESAISRRLEDDSILQKTLVNIKQDNSISQVTQTHSGRGDNVAGNKVINQNNY